MIMKRRDSSVGIALGYGLDNRGSRVRFTAGAGNFSLHHRVQNSSEAHPAPIQWVPGALPLEVKRPGREADHSPPSNTEVKEWVELYIYSPNTPSWRDAQLEGAQGQLYLFYLYLVVAKGTMQRQEAYRHCNMNEQNSNAMKY
jgi:hypothetical protein